MEKPKILIKKSSENEKQNSVHPLPPRKPSSKASNNATGLYTLPLLQPSFKFLAITYPNSTTSSPRLNLSKKKVKIKSLESSSKVKNVTYNYKLQEIPKSDRAKAERFKCSSLCMYLPWFGKTKPVKERKEETQMRAVYPVLSEPDSLENFEPSSVVTRARIQENEVDNSISSYFDLPSELFKFTSHTA
ncbi:hypothetical protein Fmac_004198 [Flemingia macrophylla]|uniref:Uncharacterized protein n=1 Tax=Flemingia macrophylla TaxID=520843 RepID=A0ABD1N484_9FABA